LPFFPLIPSHFFLTKKLQLKLDSAASNGSNGKYMKYGSFLLPSVVAARDSKSNAQQQKFLALKKYPYTQDSVMSIRS
jgi:hypothetical protein